MSYHNKCGECNVCCTRFRVAEVKWMDKDAKPKDTLCENYCNGCTIYKDRPDACATYECFWLKVNNVNNSLPVNLRPDKCNVMVTAQSEKGVGQFWLDEVGENSFDIANMTSDQKQLLEEVVRFTDNQSSPVDLFVRTHDWKTKKVNIETEQ